jgi:hypothetical protein
MAINAHDAMPAGGVITIRTWDAQFDPAHEGWQAAATAGFLCDACR